MDTVGGKEANVANDEVERASRDIDQESTVQNFQSVARLGDLSPRYLEKAKSIAKGRKKQQKDNTTAPTGGVQTMRTLTKSINQ